MKKISVIIVVIILLGSTAWYILDSKKIDETGSIVYEKTYKISREYISLRYQTDNILNNAKNYSDFNVWNDKVSKIIIGWEDLEKDSLVLEKMAKEMAEEKTSFNFVPAVLAYDQQEISQVFDKAPAGKKISTLAKYLGVDAKKAYQILKQDQAQIEADVWNKEGNDLQKYETTAVVIKDACKVAGFVGTIAMTGGTAAIAAGSTLSQAAVVVSGADLVLEITDDGAKIALGNNNKVSAIVSDARVVTEPLSAILMISTLPNNLTKGIDKLNAVAFGMDQLNSGVQEGKAIGIKLPAYTNKSKQQAKVAILEKAEISKWAEEQDIDNSPETIEDIEKILKVSQTLNNTESSDNSTQTENSNIKTEADQANLDDSNNAELVGAWEGILRSTPSQSSAEVQSDFFIILNNDGSIDPSGNGKAFSSWKKEGNSVKFFAKDDVSGAYYEFALSGNTLTFVKLAGNNSEGEWQEDFAGEDFFGGKFMQITLSKQ